jgi:zinc protease
MRATWAVAVGLVAGLPASGFTQDLPPVPPPDQRLPVDSLVRVGTLANGIRYYIRENPRPQARAELRLAVNAGSVLEDGDQLGVAHFVEHMAFNGTANFPKQALIDYLEGIGMRFGPEVNAYTSFDETVYMLTVPTDSAEVLATGFQVLRDWATALLLDPEEVELERGVVLEEWRLGRGASARMRDRQLPVIFHGSRYAERLPIGTRTSLESVGYDAVERFYREWYRPDLMAVVAVGDFDADRIQDLVHDHFADVPPVDRPRRRTVYSVPDHQETLFAVATDPEATQTQVGVLFKRDPEPSGTHGQYRRSLAEALYDAMFNQRLFELTQRADPPYLGAFAGTGSFVRSKDVYSLAALVAEGEAVSGLAALLTEAERVARHGFTETELDRAKRELIRGLEQAYAEREKTNSAAYSSEYIRHFLSDEPIPGITYELRLARAYVPGIQLAEVNALARQWITERNRVVTVSAPENAAVGTPSDSALTAVFAAVDQASIEPYEDTVTDVPLVAQPPQPAAIVEETTVGEIDLTIWRLANGVRVLLKPTTFKDDQILFRAWSPGGTSLAVDSLYLPAVTAATAVSMSGVGELNLVDLQKVLADKAVSAGPYISSLYEGLSGSASPEDVEVLFQLIYLYATAPRADPEAFQSYRTRMQAFLENRSRSPEAAFQDTLQVTLTQYHPRALPMTAERMAQLDLEGSMAFYRDRFADAGDFTFVFVGAFDVATLRPLVRRYLGALPSSGRVESWRDPGIDAPAGVVRRSVYRGVEPKSQSALVFTGTMDYTRDNRYALASLGEVLRIRLRERLREDLAGTYGVSVGATSSRYPEEEYAVRIGFGSDPERVEELTAAVFAQIDSLVAFGPTPGELDKVREIQRRERETNLEENGYWLGQLVSYDQLGIDFREILTYERLIDGLDADMVRQAAERWLRQDNYVLVTLYPETVN